MIATTEANATTHFFDENGKRLTPINLRLTEEAAKMVYDALYLTYGNEERALELWQRLRDAVGETAFAEMARAPSQA